MESLPGLAISCFGPLTVRVGGAPPPADVRWRKHCALLVYLALSPDRRRTREHLLGIVWPEKDETQARHSLSEALRRMRAGLGSGRLVVSREAVELCGEGLAVDALRFEALAGSDAGAALALARGDFLEGFDARDAAPFEEWVELHRGHYRARVAGLLLVSGERALAAGDLGGAAELARRAAEREPLSEPPLCLLMRARGLAGDVAGALGDYHAFAERLAREVGEQPGRELAALAERLRGGRWRAPAGGETAPDEPPLVGREAVHRTVFAHVAAACAGTPRVVLAVAAAGMGRSRLLAEAGRRAALEGAVIAAARPIENDHDAAWSTLRQLCRGGLCRASGALATDPSSLSVIAGFAPELAERVAPAAPSDVAHVAAALAAFLGAVAEEQPVALLLDDAHLADGATLAALGGAVRRLEHGAPVACIFSARDEANAWPPALAALASDIGQAVPGAVVTLPPLVEPEVLELIRGQWHLDESDASRRLARRLSVECGGSPFLAVTLLRALATTRRLVDDLLAWPPRSQTLDAPLPPGVSATVRMAILAQLGGLPDSAHHVLAAAALATVPVDAAALAAASGVAPEATEAALAELERRRLLIYQEGRYAFAAAVVAEVVLREEVPRGQRDALRARLAEVFGAREELEWRVAALALRAAGGPSPAVFAAAAEAADASLAQGAVRTARRALRAAEAAAGPVAGAAGETLERLRGALAATIGAPAS